jgi:N-acetyl sugar amidotransferase
MTYNICSKTVMDTSDPSIIFHKDGSSNHYSDFKNNVLPKWNYGLSRESELQKVISNIKLQGKNAEYDCILGLSGGVDSSYMLHLAVKVFGLRPLVFHVDAGWNSELAVKNIQMLVDKLGVDLYTEVVNWNDVRDFQLALFKAGVPHLDTPQDMAFMGVLYKFAKKHNIKYILNGGNISTECVQIPLKILYYATDMVQNRDIIAQFSKNKLHNYPFSSIWYHKLYLPYIKGIKVFKPLNFVSYKKEEIISFLKSEYNWKPYPQKHFESRFTKFFEGYWLPSRFGFDMRMVQFSSLILTEQMSRDDAIEALKTPAIPPSSVESEFEFIVDKLGISVDELVSYHELPLKFFYDYKNHKKFFDIGEFVLQKFMGIRRGGSA